MSVGCRIKAYDMMMRPHKAFQAPHTLLLFDKFNDLNNWEVKKVSDWSDWTSWGFSTSIYISPPQGFIIDPYRAQAYALCTLPETQDMKAGKILLWCAEQLAGLGKPQIWLGVSGPGSSYIARIGIPSDTYEFDWSGHVWYQGVNGNGDPATVMHTLGKDGAEEYIKSTAYFAPMTGSVNKIAIGSLVQSLGRAKFFDDVELWVRNQD